MRAVNGSDLRKVHEWLEVRGPVNCDNYQMAHYLQAVASKTSRRRLAQFRMGSHMLGVVCLFVCFSKRASRPRQSPRTKPCGTMRRLTCEREGGEVFHQNIMFEKCRWRTLKPQGNTGPKRPAKGNSPGEAAELPKR